MYLDKQDPRLTSERQKQKNSEEIETVHRDKLIFKKTGTFKVVKVHPKNLVKEEAGIKNIFSIDLVTISQSLPTESAPRQIKWKALILIAIKT